MTDHVVVVGGGLAGISAALAAADGGARVTLLESRPWLGGATFSFQRDGLWMDNGQHIFLRCCTAYLGLLERLGSLQSVTVQHRMAIPVLTPGGRTGWLRRGNLPVPLHLAPGLAHYPYLGWRERLAMATAAWRLRGLDPADRGLDRISFAEWLQRAGQSEHAIAALWELIALPTLNVSVREASLAAAVKVFKTGLLTTRDAADLGYAHVPLSRLHGDAAQPALAAAGVEVRTKHRVDALEPATRVASASSGTDGLTVTAGGASLDADAVILAVPHQAAANLLPAGATTNPQKLHDLGVSPIVNLHVVYDRPVTGLALAAGLGSPVQWVFDRTTAAGLDHGQYLAVSLSAATEQIDQPTQRLRQRYLPALAELFPAARHAHVERFVVTRERAATFRPTPGAAGLRLPTHTRLSGLLLAGSWTDTGWPATMEGAVRSGLAAARAALIHVGRTRHLPLEVAV